MWGFSVFLVVCWGQVQAIEPGTCTANGLLSNPEIHFIDILSEKIDSAHDYKGS